MIFLFFINVIIFISPQKLFAEKNERPPYEVSVIAQSALLMDYDSGKILWEKNSEELLYPASTTKMMTAIVAIENISDFDEVITVSETAAGRNHSSIAFRAGDRISLIDLIKLSLIFSNNNATNVLAEHIAGDVDEFVELMNKKAYEIGAFNTNFENTNGLDADYPDHKSTAKDLSIIARYSFENELFRKIVDTTSEIVLINEKEIEIHNTN